MGTLLQEDQDQLARIFEALRTGRFDDYVSLATAFAKSNSSEVLWPALAAAHGKSFNLFESLQAWPGDGIHAAMRRLLPAVAHVPQLSLEEAEQILALAERGSNSHRYNVVEVLRSHLNRSPELGEQLGDKLRRRTIRGEGCARVWAGAFGSGAPAIASRYAVQLCNVHEGDVGLMAVLLQFLPVTDAAVMAGIAHAESALVEALMGMAPEPSSDAWHALASIADVSPAAMDALQQAVEAGATGAIMALSLLLQRSSSATVGATAVPIEPLLRCLLQRAVQDSTVRPTVDSVIAGMLYRESSRPAALQCIGDLRGVDGDLDEMFPETLDGICEQQSDFARLLTEWLVAEGIALSAMRSLLARCSRRHAQVALDTAVFGGATAQRKIVAARRLLSLTHNGPVICQFIACLAEQPSLQPDGLNLAAQMLDAAFVEYPHAIEEFLRERTSEVDRRMPCSRVYRSVYANVLRWRLVLRRLPQLAELRPTDTQLQALRAMRQRMNREIMRGAAKKSVLASLFTNVHLAQGRRFATHTPHGAPQVVEMTQASHSIELPSSELADPVGGMLRRAQALAASR